MPHPVTQILEEVSKTTIQLLLKEPFYGHFFTGILKEVTETIPTMAVGLTSNKMVKLYVNPIFWKEDLNSSEFRYGVLKHEILHIVLKHIITSKNFSNKRIFNIAADIVVNQYIATQQLPEGAVTLALFPDFKMEANREVGYYYDILNKEWQQMLNSNYKCEADGSSSKSGSGKGNISKDNLYDLMTNVWEELDRHDLWTKEFEKLSEAERKIVDAYLNEIIKNGINRVGAKGIGSLPGNLRAYLNQLMESLKPNVDWRRILRIFTTSSSKTYIKNTIRRPSKRYGTTPGIKIKQKNKILVAVDTSGSIGQQELKAFFGELYHIWKQGAEIMVAECDTAISHTFLYKGKPPEFVHGRGGTDFNDPIRYANEEYFPDAIVYFTDGYGAVPHIKSRKPILWLLSPNGIAEDQYIGFPGRRVKMK
jgi:predicted metal-dependent peptidase